jgi:hypothetical protein
VSDGEERETPSPEAEPTEETTPAEVSEPRPVPSDDSRLLVTAPQLTAEHRAAWLGMRGRGAGPP